MSKGEKGATRALGLQRLLVEQHCALIRPYPPTTNREKNKESGPNGSLMNNKAPLMF